MIIGDPTALAASKPPVTSPGGELSGRLQSYSRFVALVAEQLDALQRNDLTRAQLLEGERSTLEHELSTAAAAPPVPPPDHTALAGLVEAGLDEIDTRTAVEQETRDRWTDIQSGALRAARTLHPTPLPGEYRDFSVLTAKVDVRS